MMTGGAISAGLKYIASKVDMPEGVELFVDDGQAVRLVMAQDESGAINDRWLVRFIKKGERKVKSWVVRPDVGPRELYDHFIRHLDDSEGWRDWPE